MSIDIAYILGAGASYTAGFPLAAGMTDAIRTFVASLDDRPRCERLRETGETILRLMKDRGYRTVDELSYEVRSEDNGRIVRYAKAIMTALFLDLERGADLGRYRRAVRTMIDANDLALPPEGEMRIPTRAICLNYNHDRCLPAAMYRSIAEGRSGLGAETELRVQRLLNSGASTMSERLFDIDTTRFSDLRMHRLVGTYLDDRDDESPVRGQALDAFGKVEISDDLLLPFETPGELASTMIFFPWENHLPRRVKTLIENTDRAAASFLTRVKEIRVVGYSMSEMNAPRLDRLLGNAQQCKVVTVWDPSDDVAKLVEAALFRVGLSPKILHFPVWNP
jgi:hypothetical protein